MRTCMRFSTNLERSPLHVHRVGKFFSFSSASSFTTALSFWLWFSARQMSILFLPKHLLSIFYTHIPQVQFGVILLKSVLLLCLPVISLLSLHIHFYNMTPSHSNLRTFNTAAISGDRNIL